METAHGIVLYLSTHGIEAVGFATTLLGIWLTTRRSMLCWPFIMVANLCYLEVLSRAFLLSGALLQFAYMSFTVYGWWHWARGKRAAGEVRIEPLGRRGFLGGLAAGVGGAILLGWLMAHTRATLVYFDAALASFSVLATWWQVRRHSANWWLWIVVDLCYVGEYLTKRLYLTVLLYACLIVLACVGLRSWRQAPQSEARPA